MWLYRFVYFLVPLILGTFFRIKWHDKEKIPAEGPVLMIGNHIDNLDPIVMMRITKRPLSFMAKEEIFTTTPILTWAAKKMRAFPISRGKADLSGVRHALSILKGGDILLIFPEGTRRKGGSGPMLPLYDGVALMALKSGAPVVPFFIEGTYSFRHGVNIHVGDPIDLTDFDARRVDKATMEAFMQRCRQAIHAVGGIQEGDDL